MSFKNNLQFGDIGIRITIANVNGLLSSKTNLNFQSKLHRLDPPIPTRYIRFFFVRNVRRHNVENIPSVQSFVAASNRPNICVQ